MKKKIFVLGACLMMVMGLASCGSSTSYDKYNLDDYIEVGKYKGLEVDGYVVNITEDNIDAYIDNLLEDSISNQEVSKGTPVEDGDTVNIDYVGKLNGKKFDGGSSEGYDLVIGSDTLIPGFEDGLIGKKVGDKVDLNLTFPEDYSDETLQGKDVVFSVTINSATRVFKPTYDEEFVKNNTEYETTAEYEAALAKMLYEEKEAEEITNQQSALWSQVLDNTKVKKYPEKIVKYFVDFNSKMIDEMAKAYDISREEMLANYDFGDEEEFAAVNEDSCRLQVKQEMIIEYIAAKEGITYKDKEAKAMIKEFEDMGYDEKTIKSQTGRSMDEYVRIELLYQKVLEFLLENATIK